MRFISFANRNMKEVYRDPISILLGLVMPAALLLLFSSIYRNSQWEMFSPQSLTPGMIIFSFAFVTMFSGTLIAKDKQGAFLIRLFTTPLRSSDFILAYTLPFIPIAFCQVLVCFGIGAILGATFSNIMASLVIFFLIALICICLGMIIGSLFTVNQVSGIGAFIIVAISLFSGAWMDLRMIGGVFETVGYVLPFAHAVDAANGLLKGYSFAEIINNFYFILLTAMVLIVFAILSFKWTMRRK